MIDTKRINRERGENGNETAHLSFLYWLKKNSSFCAFGSISSPGPVREGVLGPQTRRAGVELNPLPAAPSLPTSS